MESGIDMGLYYHTTGYISGHRNHTYARVPFYWNSSRVYQEIYKVGDGAPFWLTYTTLSLAGCITSACLIQFSLGWIYPTVIIPLLWVFFVLQGLWIADQPINGSNRERILEISRYKALPRKIRRELKKSAKQMDKSILSESDLPNSRWNDDPTDWQKIVKGYAEMNPQTEKPKYDPVAQAKAKFDERLTEVQEKRKVLQEQKDLEAEIQAEVRDRVKKQMEAEGKVYVELNV